MEEDQSDSFTFAQLVKHEKEENENKKADSECSTRIPRSFASST